MPPAEIDALDAFTVEQFRRRVTHAGDRTWVADPFLCSGLPGGGAQLSPVIGYGMVEQRRAEPRVHDPHGFDLAWLRAVPGEGVLTHRHHRSQVLSAKAGRWAVSQHRGRPARRRARPARHAVGAHRGVARGHTARHRGRAGGRGGTGELLVVNGGNGRTVLEWAPEVVAAAGARGRVLDANGYLAPAAVLAAATEDDRSVAALWPSNGAGSAAS